MIEYANSKTPNRKPWGVMGTLSWVASAIAWTAMALFAMGVVGGVLAIVVAKPAGSLGPLVGLTAILVIASAARDVRRRGAVSALVYLEQSVRLNLPLTPMLAAARMGERPGVAARVMHIEELVAAGTGVADAVEAALPELPGRVLRSIRSAERLGRLPDALARAVDHERPREPHDPIRVFYKAYPLLLLACVSAVMTLLMVFVFPKFEDILRDFGEPMPPITKWLVGFASMIVPVVAVGSALAILLMGGRALWEVFVPRRMRLPLRGIGDPIEWATPVLGRAALDRGMADVCWLLADAAEAGLPLPQALTEAEKLDVNSVLHGRITTWRKLVEAGASLADGARTARMPHVLVGMLGTTTTGLADVLRFLARYYGARFSRTQALIRAATVPAVALGLGVVVALVGLAMFTPLISMTQHLSVATSGKAL